MRGTPPSDLRVTLQHAIEAIHLQQTADLERFSGDASIFDDARPVLQECLESRFREDGAPVSYRKWWMGAGLVAAVLAGWLGVRWVEQRRFDRYLAALDDQPGLVVINARRQGGRFVVSGLRDPLAVDPSTLIAGTGLLPESNRGPMGAVPGARSAAGPASRPDHPPAARGRGAGDAGRHAWWPPARPRRPGCARPRCWRGRCLAFANSTSAGIQNAELRGASRRLEAAMVQFVRGTSELVSGQDQAIGTMIAELRQLDAAARQARVRLKIVVTGHTDADGAFDRNLTLSAERAAAVVAALPRQEWPSLDFESRGVGSAEPIAIGTTEADKQRNRRVAVRIHPLGAS